MKIAVPREIKEGERCVALVPEAVARLVKTGLEVEVEAGAGKEAFFLDSAYEEAGAMVASDAAFLWGDADVVLKVRSPRDRHGAHEVDMLREGSVLIGFLDPLGDPSLVERLAGRNITAFAMELIPRISRAQGMDALSSFASLAGYKAALMAANALGRFFPMLTTAAGTIAPAKVLVIGAGVAGLQAIATARRLGAVVEAFDIRPDVKEQVQSLGAGFVEVEIREDALAEGGYAKDVSEAARKREQDALLEHVGVSDVVITTAQVPGRKAPLLVTERMVGAMKAGSVIVDIAAEQGGNCELTRAGQDVVHRGVRVLGPVNLPSTIPVDSSRMYARNVSALLRYLIKDDEIRLDFEDEIIKGACVTHKGVISGFLERK